MDRATGPARSGIAQTASGDAYIPSSTRADGSKRKEIRIRPGYVPPEDIETYKNQRADALKNRGKAGIPGAEGLQATIVITDGKSKNAKRRDAAKKRLENMANGDELADTLEKQNLDEDKLKADWRDPEKLQTNTTQSETNEAERQKKIRNSLKKLKAVRELKDRRAAGEKMSIDQVAKMGKEPELLWDLQKLKYDGPEMADNSTENDQESSEEARV
jgi:partner of Y14 and mago protein